MPRADTETGAVILEAASALLEAHGPAGLTTRAVCEAAGVKAPTLYHYFGDKDGLERALIQHGLAEFMQRKRALPDSADPLAQLRYGWDVALEFALKRPALHGLFVQHARSQPSLLDEAYTVLYARVQRLVDMGRFRAPADLAARAFFSASQGVQTFVSHGLSRKELEAVSELVFHALVNELSRTADTETVDPTDSARGPRHANRKAMPPSGP